MKRRGIFSKRRKSEEVVKSGRVEKSGEEEISKSKCKF
jgi:hypothetical protein